ncbi:ABC transporter substrate-binding protein [Robbsia sp. KACC 23696]|uniref:ABC transporter substrate-binding protein n=1 Tax=Robbsia sp. KACC 23696 TaxID=3149231 RepID=UPI00325B8682
MHASIVSLIRRVARTGLLVGAAGGAAALLLPPDAAAAPASAEPYYFGVSGPLTGVNAQYGEQWRAGFDLALAALNADGGVQGHPLAYTFEDSQSDPRQSVTIAQKFVGDARILIELGDFSSPASMAASPIYQRAGLVQLGFTNSHPDFTKGGDYIWSPSLSQAEEQPEVAKLAVSRGLHKIAVLYQNTDWGRTSRDVFAEAAKRLGATVVDSEGYQPLDKDFRATLVRVQAAHPDGIVLISYYADGAQIVRQARGAGIDLPIVATSSVYSPKFLELAGDAADGVVTHTNFFADEQRPEVQRFVSAFEARYHRQPDAFNAYAYDAVNIAAAALRQSAEGGQAPTRRGVRDALAQLHNVPSVIFGTFTFDSRTRRASGARNINLVVRNGTWALLPVSTATVANAVR